MCAVARAGCLVLGVLLCLSERRAGAATEPVRPQGGTRVSDTPAPATARPRLIVLTDIGGDPDDQQSMIRLMTFANELEIEGLIASASGVPGELKQAISQPHLIREIVEAYGTVLPNLRQHAEGYPAGEDLLARVKSGNSQRGWDQVGDGHDTEDWVLLLRKR